MDPLQRGRGISYCQYRRSCGEGRTGIWVRKQRGEREDDLEQREGGRPVVLEDIDTYSTPLVNIHMIYTGQNEP